MASAADKPSLAERMKPRPTAPAAGDRGGSTTSSSFKTAGEEYPKRLTLDLTAAQHRKLKMLAAAEDTTMNQILRDYIDNLST